MITIRKAFLCLLIFCIHSKMLPAYPYQVAHKDSLSKEFYIIDTVIIKDPVLIKFANGKHQTQTMLVPRSFLIANKKNKSMTYEHLLFSQNCFLFFPGYQFACLASKMIYEKISPEKKRYYEKLTEHLMNTTQNQIYSDPNISFLKLNGWEYNSIIPRKFLLCLVKGSALRRCQSIDHIQINNCDNVYFKLLVPLTW